MLPVITIFLREHIHDAIGTSLVLDFFIGGIAGLIFLKRGNTDFKSLWPIILFGSIGAIIGSNFTSSAPERSLLILTAILLIVFGINFIINGVRKNIECSATNSNCAVRNLVSPIRCTIVP